MKKKIEYILLDAANTLIHKPDLWIKFEEVLSKNGVHVAIDELKRNHKLVSEVIKFPDVTSESFYEKFNAEVLRSLGIIPSKQLLNELFENCKYLPWQAFDDVGFLKDYNLPLGILSNFSSKLENLLKDKIPSLNFQNIFISENEGVAKPDKKFFQVAIDGIGLAPESILYIGDSVKLDLEPAIELGMSVALIDREGFYPNSKFQLIGFDKIVL